MLFRSNRFPSIGLTKTFLNFRQETEPFDSIFKGSRIRKTLHNLKDFLLDPFSGHRNHLVRLGLSAALGGRQLSYPAMSAMRILPLDRPGLPSIICEAVQY